MMKYVYRDLLAVLKYLPWGLVTGGAAGLLLVWLLGDRGDCRSAGRTGTDSPDSGQPAAGRRGRKAAVIVFCIYVALMLMITFLSRESGSRIGVDLELLSTWGINDRNNAYVVENVLLFIPYGLISCWAFLKIRRLFACMALGAATSLGIELLQLATGRGYFQIDDILTNILGTLIGFLLFKLLGLLGGRS